MNSKNNSLTGPKCKFCFICPVDFIGGAELFVFDFINEISTRKNKTAITVICSNHKEFIKRLPQNVEIVKMDFPRLKKFSPLALWDFYQTSRKLSQKIFQINPQAVMSNSIRAHLLCAQIFKANKNLSQKTKLSFFVHDFTFPKLFFKWAKKQANQIFTCSEIVKQDLINKGGNAKKITVVPNGVKMNEKLKIKNVKLVFNLNSQQPIIGIIGRLDPWKGQGVFIEAAKIILKQSQNFKFLIFGKSSEHDHKTVKFEKALKQKVQNECIDLEQNIALKNFIEFRGFVPSDEALSQINILIHASTQPEPFGRVIIEAMNAGVPVIASDLGGSQEIVENNQNGLLIKPHQPLLLAKTILNLAQDQKLQEKFIKNGLKTVKEKFSLSSISDKLYQELF